ncbi:MAG: ADP-ribosylglycohydrolase family protein [Gemmataceae bacterium]|nr:ADP-ribosylglycohydrolase family protein [Gemmataceae bacterium]
MTLPRARGCLLGLAVGDAVGTTVEFQPRGSFTPVTDMTGGGPFHLPAGAWTDDTSMALCLADSLISCSGFNPVDQMQRYCRWYETGYLSSIGRCFDIGGTTRTALTQFRQTGDPFSGPTDGRSAGNGCIMRLAPVPIYFHADCENAEFWAGESSRTTHGAAECIESSRLLARMLWAAMAGQDKDAVLFGHDTAGFQCDNVRAIVRGEYRTKDRDAIRGTGYVIDCLEAAAWCFWKSDNYKDAVLLAVNLGDDADTTGAVCGQLAGAFWGEAGIPKSWLSNLVLREEIEALANELMTPKTSR